MPTVYNPFAEVPTGHLHGKTPELLRLKGQWRRSWSGHQVESLPQLGANGVIDKGVAQAQVDSPEKTLSQTQQEAPETDPLESWENRLQETMHVERVWRDEPKSHAQYKTGASEQGCGPGDDFGVQHSFELVL